MKQIAINLILAITSLEKHWISKNKFRGRWVIWIFILMMRRVWRFKNRIKLFRRNSFRIRSHLLKEVCLVMSISMLRDFWIGMLAGRLPHLLLRRFWRWIRLDWRKARRWRLWDLLRIFISSWLWFGSCFKKEEKQILHLLTIWLA